MDISVNEVISNYFGILDEEINQPSSDWSQKQFLFFLHMLELDLCTEIFFVFYKETL